MIPSSSVIPPKDSGTYFVNSGMNQFKNIFLSQNNSNPRQSVVNYQKCIRVGGKHNDLSDVGHDTYHHTFFEMLGNWAFNNAYFKRQACAMAYDLLTRVYGLDKDRLFFTYFQGEANLVPADDETREIWIDLGIDPKRVLPFGMKENFWEMGDTGPCGPCTEIHYDHTGQGDPSQVNRDNPRVVELWNLVFMQYERRQDKSLRPLSQVHVDTGMGLERLVAVLNGSESNYDTDLFTPLFDVIHASCPPSASIPVYSQANKTQQYAYRLLADHARMFTIAIGDGLVPEKKGIGGLLKKMIERATRIAHEYLHIDEQNVALLSTLIPHVTKILQPAYPDLKEKLHRTVELVKHCELNYISKYQNAKPFLERFIHERSNSSQKFISGEEIYQLYAGKFENINVPLEMIEEYTRLYPSITFDWTSFDHLMREETRKSKLFSVYNKTLKANQAVLHHPIDQLSDLLRQNSFQSATMDEPYKYQAEEPIDAQLRLIIESADGKELKVVQTVHSNGKYYVLLDRTNFYATAGGQSSDQGTLHFSDQLIFHVEDVFRLHDQILHYGHFQENGTVSQPRVTCHVDMIRRLNLSRNHTATHLVNRVLREVLNDPNLTQKASLIHEDYFIYEYSTIVTNKSKTIFEELEKGVNEAIEKNLPVSSTMQDFNAIRADSSIYRLSNESYPGQVRCLSIGPSYSRELCCGTHVTSTGQIEDFLLVRVDSKGQSNKRLYCLTGSYAKHVRQLFDNDFQQRFQYLEEHRDQIPLAELFAESRKLRETYLDERSLMFPYNQRQHFYSRWQTLMPDKKLLRKSLLNQLHDHPDRLFIHSKADLPIYEIGFMLLRYDDPEKVRQHQPYVVYVNSDQRLIILYLKNPRERQELIQFMQKHFKMNLLTNFHSYDEQTRDLFTGTKKLLVFTAKDQETFDRLNFEKMCETLFSTKF